MVVLELAEGKHTDVLGKKKKPGEWWGCLQVLADKFDRQDDLDGIWDKVLGNQNDISQVHIRLVEQLLHNVADVLHL